MRSITKPWRLIFTGISVPTSATQARNSASCPAGTSTSEAQSTIQSGGVEMKGEGGIEVAIDRAIPIPAKGIVPEAKEWAGT